MLDPLTNFRMLGHNHSLFKLLSSVPYYFPSHRKVVDIVQSIRDDSTKSNVKKALLAAKKKDRIKLPTYEDIRSTHMYHVSEFLNHPAGIEAMLNVSALESHEPLDANTYRCKLSPIQLLNFKVSPIMDLQVNPTTEGCSVDLLTCKFEGSEIVESQNKYFSASMKNFINWDEVGSESFLHADVKLNISLEIYNRPFSFLPVSAVEGPGNIVMQALLDRFVPLLLQQLVQDYDTWVKQQHRNLP